MGAGQTSQLSGFKLDWATPPTWVARVEQQPLRLLSDHAHCELKAAVSAQALIAKNPADHDLVREMTSLALEELEHFGRVHALLVERGGALERVLPSPYAEGLMALASRERAAALLDRLLIASLIEARSLERFHLLSVHLQDQTLAQLYAQLLSSEARHQALFVRLARRNFAREQVEERLAVLRAAEGQLLAQLGFEYRMHSGVRDL